jgi:hypothetical protein
VRFGALAALLILAACQQDPPVQGARDDSAPLLTAEGYGPVSIGMTLEDARTASGAPLNEGGGVTDEDAHYCQEQPWVLADGDKLYLMFEEGRLTRISADSDATHVRTAQNVGVGSTDAEVRAAYQDAAETPAKYDDPPAHDLTAWIAPDQAGLRFEVNEAGLVTQVHAGGPSILYVEGCA